MRKIKRLLAFALTLIMTLCMCPIANAESTPTNNLTSDATISVTGLEKGDTVTFYQVLKYDDGASKTHGWINGTGFTLSDGQIQQILGTDGYKDSDEAGISDGMAATIANMTKSETASYTKYEAIAGDDKSASYSNPDAGLYVAIITPAIPGTMYNPVFVGADYKNTNGTNTQEATTSLSYSNTSMAKRADTTLEKTAEDANTIDENNSETVGVGDVVSFTVTTKIPEFADNYTDAAYTVTDTMSTGLELQTDSIVVKVADQTVDASDTTFTVTTSTTGYTVSFNKDYLLGLDAASDLVITYNAKVTTNAPKSLNKEDNTVVVSFSNNPNDASSKTKLIDKTNHYTFDIDANLLGDTTNKWETTEVVKVGLDADGNEITETTKTLHQGQSSVGALEGAEFKLYTNEDCKEEHLYTNSILTAKKVIVSDGTGRLTISGETIPGIRGLDAGTYWLMETKAPDGYIRHQNAIKIEIIPSYNEQFEEEVDSEGTTLKVTTKVLTGYEVKIDGQRTANYTITNAKDNVASESNQGDTVTGNDEAGYINATGGNAAAGFGKITNTQGTELPSTGGIGTTIFYIVGGVMVAGAAIFLLTKRRVTAE